MSQGFWKGVGGRLSGSSGYTGLKSERIIDKLLGDYPLTPRRAGVREEGKKIWVQLPQDNKPKWVWRTPVSLSLLDLIKLPR